MSWHAGTAFDPAGNGNGNILHQSPGSQHISPVSGSPPAAAFGDRKRKRGSEIDEIATPVGELGGNGYGPRRTLSLDADLANSSPMTGRPKHQPGVKRACNDCRQQKLRCNVVAGPGEQYRPCDRCIKHGLKCSIDNDFKRLGKRAAHEEMVKELDMARAKLAQYEAMGITLPNDQTTPNYGSSYTTSPAGSAPAAHMTGSSLLGPNEAAASRSLIDLSQGYREMPPTSYPSITPGASPKTLRGVSLTEEQITDLYGIYFTSFHPFLPVLNPDFNYNQYYTLHPLLHWTIISVAARRYDNKPGLLVELQQPLEEMLWTTLSHVPQVYHVTKALALLCAWPMPTSSTSTEPTMMLAGVMFQLAMQYGLHRPSHAQDFSRFRVDLHEEDIADRLNTWATVNIVAQMVSTGQGQPPLARWAWYTYGLHLDRMKPELHTRCQIEKFCDTVTRTLFTMQRDHLVEVDQAQRGLQIEMYARELNEMELTIMSTRSSPIETLYLKAAALHLRLSAFFDRPSQPNYMTDLRNVYIAASSLLTNILDLPDDLFLYVPRYIEQMMLAGAVTLLKLLNSFYATHVDIISGRTLFGRTVNGLRKLSVRSNDLPQRLAEVMAQLWQTSGASEQKLFPDSSTTGEEDSKPAPRDESLQLRVRCRSSLSVLYDAIWRWRQQVGVEGRQNLEKAVEHPTAISASAGEMRAATPQPGTLAAVPNAGANPGLTMGGNGGGGLLDGSASGAGGGNSELGVDWDVFGGNAVFDPLSWALDGNLQFGGFGLGGSDGLGGFQV
ncbi:hypothetical protein KC345_g1286 [Hortaea werneckii]|nr:hypothetical protein KC345_g1286 [Hortaea werneckii]